MKKNRTTSTANSTYIVCPFFRSHNDREVICEGFFAGCSCGLKFKRAEDKAFHQANYCEKNYTRCELYLSVMHWRWEDR